MGGVLADLMLVATERTEASTTARFRVKNAWAYHWPENDKLLRLRVNEKGHVLKHTGGLEHEPNSYRTFFTTSLGALVNMAFSTDPEPLSEPHIRARLEPVTVERAGGLLVYHRPETRVRADGVRHTIETPVLGQVVLKNYIPRDAATAVAVVTFGGPRNDTQAVLMDRFLKDNYGETGGVPKRFTGRPNVYEGVKPRDEVDEFRVTVQASGKSALALVRDLAKAAKALNGADAAERIVALTSHGFYDEKDHSYSNPMLGRVLFGDALSARDMTALLRARGDIALARKQLLTAKETGDPQEIQARQEALDDTLANVGPKAVEFIGAFEDAANAMEDAAVSKVDLQACNAAGVEPTNQSLFGLRDELRRLLSTSKHKVQVRAHHKMLSTFTPGELHGKEPVSVYLGYKPSKELWSRDDTQYSKDTLPVPK